MAFENLERKSTDGNVRIKYVRTAQDPKDQEFKVHSPNVVVAAAKQRHLNVSLSRFAYTSPVGVVKESPEAVIVPESASPPMRAPAEHTSGVAETKSICLNKFAFTLDQTF